MMMRQMPLSSGEQRFLGVANELRPALAEGDPSVSVARHGRVISIIGGWHHLCSTEKYKV